MINDQIGLGLLKEDLIKWSWVLVEDHKIPNFQCEQNVNGIDALNYNILLDFIVLLTGGEGREESNVRENDLFKGKYQECC